MSIDDFIKGQEDCEKGIPHTDKSPDYTRGYDYEYWRQENRTATSIEIEGALQRGQIFRREQCKN